MFKLKDAEEALIKLAELKGKERAQLIEKILRLETNHFRSKQYALTGSAGMEDGKWSGIKQGTYSTIQMNDNHLTGEKRLRTFIKWNNVLDACIYLSDYIDRYGGNYARWNSLNPDRQEMYRGKVQSIRNRTIK